VFEAPANLTSQVPDCVSFVAIVTLLAHFRMAAFSRYLGTTSRGVWRQAPAPNREKAQPGGLGFSYAYMPAGLVPRGLPPAANQHPSLETDS
jgi:hypothetical protein